MPPVSGKYANELSRAYDQFAGTEIRKPRGSRYQTYPGSTAVPSSTVGPVTCGAATGPVPAALGATSRVGTAGPAEPWVR